LGLYYNPPQPPAMAPSIVPEVYPVATDNPPFVHPGRPGPEFFRLLAAWVNPDTPDPLPYRRQITSALAGWSVDNPPTRRDPSLPLITMQWQPPDPLPYRRQITSAVPGWSVDTPPLGISNLPTILITWRPPDPQPYQAVRSMVPTVYPVIFNDPPFGQARNSQSLSTVISWWLPDPLPQGSRISWIPIYQPIVVANPPFILPLVLYNILDSWIPPDPQPRQIPPSILPTVYPVQVSNPPFGIPSPNLPTILATWRPPDPQPQRIIPTSSFPGYSVDNPPVGIPNPNLPSILVTWRPPDPQPQRWIPSIIPSQYPVVVYNPPFDKARSSQTFYEILNSWVPPEPIRMASRAVIQPGITVTVKFRAFADDDVITFSF